MRIYKLAALFIAAVITSMTGARPAAAAETAAAGMLRISEVQTGSVESANHEFVELYNPTDNPIDLAGWRLEYKSATGTVWTIKAVLSGQIGPQAFFVVATAGLLPEAQGTLSSGLAAAGGHVRLSQISGDGSAASDLVGWGTADSPEGSTAAPVPTPNESIQRCFTGDELGDTDANAADFLAYAEATPGVGIVCAPPTNPPEPPDNRACEAVILSEILPNPAGADSDREFIELYNPTTEQLDLTSCSLLTAIDTDSHSLTNIVLNPGTYYALYGSVSGLTLANTNGGEIFLAGTDGEILHSVAYPAALANDTAWAYIHSSWEITFNPTPGAPNISQPLKPCPEGQIRNDETGRCRIAAETVDTEPTLTPCQPGQERNPATNRCRTIASASAALTPCKSGQERNPETNRCRAVAAAATALKPCPAGQERNPETTRCRKVAAPAIANPIGVQDVAATSVRDTIGWWIAGLVATGALSYAIFEWRHEIRQLLIRLKQKTMR